MTDQQLIEHIRAYTTPLLLVQTINWSVTCAHSHGEADSKYKPLNFLGHTVTESPNGQQTTSTSWPVGVMLYVLLHQWRSSHARLSAEITSQVLSFVWRSSECPSANALIAHDYVSPLA